MSYEAVAWALKQPVGHSPAKFVLVAMAERARDDKRAWPSISMIAEDTCQNRKTVIANVQRLVDMGYLLNTGERVGQTKSVVVYELAEPTSCTKTGTSKQYQNLPQTAPKETPLSNTDFGTASAIEAVPKTTVSSTKKSPKQSQKLPEAVPKSSTEPVRTSKGTSNEPVIATLSASDLESDGVSLQVANEFLAIRKKKRAPLTPIALAGIKREAAGVGWTLDQTLRKCIERGWQGFEATWVKPDKPGATRHGNFDKQDYRAGVNPDGSF